VGQRIKGKGINPIDLLLNKIRWLDNIGRSSRSNKNEKLENFLSDLQRLTIVHETDNEGHGSYRFTSGAKDEDKEGEGSEKKQDDGKNKDKGKSKEDAKKGVSGAEGDKSMDDQHGVGREAENEKDKKEKKEREESSNPRPRDKEGNKAAQGGKAEEH
jgi:H+-transporting ATPase